MKELEHISDFITALKADSKEFINSFLRRLDILEGKYSPDQPRVPAGNPDGGQWTSDFNTNSAVNHLNSQADMLKEKLGTDSFGEGRCAHYVTQAIKKGGVNIKAPSPAWAKNYGPQLEKAGFVKVTGSDQPSIYPTGGYIPKKGDVAIIQPTSKSKYGHIAMYNGNQWVSDFRQRSFWPGQSYRIEVPSYTIYRH